MKYSYIDIHSHLNDSSFDEDRDEVFTRMRESSVSAILVGTDKAMSERALVQAQNQQDIWATIGQHPTDRHLEIFDEEWYDMQAKNSKVVAIGECGLDFFRMKEDTPEERNRQRELFLKQLHLAVRHNLPLMIHCRDAHPEMLDVLVSCKKEYGDKLRGNIHFFADSYETAKKYFDLDFTISFTGVITFARTYDEVIKNSPLERIMSETDCPYVAPTPHRGKRNESSFVPLVVVQIAAIRGESLEKVSVQLLSNAQRVFALEFQK